MTDEERRVLVRQYYDSDMRCQKNLRDEIGNLAYIFKVSKSQIRKDLKATRKEVEQ